MDSGNFFPLIAILGCLLWVYFSFRYFLYYRGRISNGMGNPDKNTHLVRRAQLSLLVSSLVFTGTLVTLLNLPRVVIPPPATATLTPDLGSDLSLPGAGQPQPTPGVSTPLETSSPTPEVIPSSGTARIGNTNGFGVFVRSEPGLKYEMLAQLSDGSRVELTGEVQTADGFTWQRVLLEDGRSGWIAENFLIPEP